MTAIQDATSGKSAAATVAAATGKNEIAGNFQDFLLLLTTQLKNQSPLDPLDTNQFTQQLVQFAGVEQQLKGNDTLNSILGAMKTTSTANAASYVGLAVTADGSTAPLAGGAATWTINATKAASKATITVADSSGTVVATKNQALKLGAQSFTWDGKDAKGVIQAEGNYTITIKAVDASGQPVQVSTDVAGTVSAVDVSGTTPVLTVGTNQVPLASIKSIASR
ncbi:MAG: flagellar hook capping protein [Enterovirga sp.]|nr:flagellar hook capping protein [Enterovirga sp.]